ncbi:MAG TPA: hypothetical protein VFW50_14325 [Streptosporangiaceae bacterium]|nr:hypothetical protein [Streptosporangiaceae bacterium]
MSGRSSPPDGEADDFTQISGIGKILDRRLHDAGVSSYADLAALNPEGIASLLAEPAAIRPGRIADEDWTGQAARLAAETAETAEDQPDAAGGEAGDDIPATAPGVSGGSRRHPQHPQRPTQRIRTTRASSCGYSCTSRMAGSPARPRSTSAAGPSAGGRDWTRRLCWTSSRPTCLPEQPIRSRPVRPAGPQCRASGATAGPSAARSAHAGAAARAAGGEPALRPAAPAPTSGPGGGPAPVPGGRPAPAPGEVSLALVRDLRVPRPDEPFTLSVTLDLTASNR